MSPTRRKFLCGFGGVALVSVSSKYANSHYQHLDQNHRDVLSVLDDLVVQPECARVIGKQYLHQYPHEADVATLIGLILQNSPRPLSNDYDGAGMTSVSQISRNIRNDFAVGQIVVVDGWYLSKTEARICSIYCFENN